MALTRARADSAVSSTATRADGPAPGSRKSIFRVCSAWACTGWSKYTLASVSRNHPAGPLPLIETFSVRYVHMLGSSQPRGGLQVAAVEVPDALPGLHGRLGPVARPVDLQEGVSGPVVEVELIGLAVRLERLLEFSDLFR